jgi:hypothetical protein
MPRGAYMTKKELAFTVRGYLGTFGREPSDIVVSAYVGVLGELTDQQCLCAINAAASQDREYPLSAGQLRTLGITGGLGRDVLVQRAWDTLCRAITTHGYTQSVNFSDGLINATVRHLGGWEYACSRPVEDFEKWYRRDFIETYSALLSTGCTPDRISYLPGAVERENGRWHEQVNPRSGEVYRMPAPEAVAADGYEPAVKSLPAGERRKSISQELGFEPKRITEQRG